MKALAIMADIPQLQPVYIDGDGIRQSPIFFSRRNVENYKLGLMGKPPLPNDQPLAVLDQLISARTACRELDISRRTLGRRLMKARQGAPGGEKSALDDPQGETVAA